MSMIDTATRLIIARTDAYLADAGKGGSLRQYPTLEKEVSELTDEDLKDWARISGTRDRKIKLKEAESRYLFALDLLENDTVLQTLLELCVTEFIYPEFSAYLKANFDCDPCLHLAAVIEGRDGLSFDEIRRYARLARRLLIIDLKAEPLQYTKVSAEERLIGFLSGDDGLHPGLSDFTRVYTAKDELHEAFVNQDIIEKGIDHLSGQGRVLCLAGSGGRRFIARHIAKGLGSDFLFLNIADLIRQSGPNELASRRDMLIREAYSRSAGICLYGFNEQFITGGISDKERGRRDMETLAGMLFQPLEEEDIRLILCVDELKMMPGREFTGNWKVISLPESYDYEERKRLWQGLFELHGLKLDAASFASRYRMNPREAAFSVLDYIEESVDQTAPDSKEQDQQAREERFARISLESLQDTGDGTGRIIYPDVKLEDVKLKDKLKRVLKDTVNAVLSGPVILDEWGLKKNYPYGRGVSLLMTGPPGTGKTMSANAIAGELSLPLYQVNLSNVVDKYIGETEKNLERAFSFAEKHNVILFFDEADALFGTRSEIHDSKDRYANNEVSYLLQRMEAYDGVVLMATNIKGNIDPAFMRRIRFVAHFENPDEEMRRAIWEGCLTEEIPHEEIDLDYLAKQFDTFTGSVIKTVFLNACSFAAPDGVLQMKHLIYAIRQEKEKESAVNFTMDTLGKYAYLA